MSSLNQYQLQLLYGLCSDYLEANQFNSPKYLVVTREHAADIEKSGLCELVDIEIGYCNDDFIKNRMSLRFGWAHLTTCISRMVLDDSMQRQFCMDQIDEVIDREIQKAKGIGRILQVDFCHVEYNELKDIVEITTFLKYKK